MKIAIMQPYIFPYIGYFQLIDAVDKFVFYDDVNFIKGGWIHRNKLLSNQAGNLFTLPLQNPSSFKAINKTIINRKIFNLWKIKFFKTIQQSYSKAPYYNEIYPIIERVFKVGESTNIGFLAAKSILEVCDYLDIKKQWFFSSENFSESQNIERTQRLLNISKSLDAEFYINTIGGKELYNNNDFSENGITLKFINTGKIEYVQYSNDFVPNLSIIDVLMFNSKQETLRLLKQYTLIS